MMNKHVMRSILAVLAAGASSLAFAQAAAADLGFTSVGASLNRADGTFSRQAGDHPDLTIRAQFSHADSEAVRNFDVDLPVGLTGNPVGLPTCSRADLQGPPGQGFAVCPADTQVGTALVDIYGGGTLDVGVYNLEPGSDAPARFGFNFSSTTAIITARVRPGDYGVSSGSFAISQALRVQAVTVTLWGVPTDPIHDASRGGPSHGPRRPFMTNPTSCTDSPVAFTMRGDSWQAPDRYVTEIHPADFDGTPFVFDGCERLPFEPSIEVQPLSHTADAPTGLNVDLTVPQNDAPNGLATAHVRKAVVTLPKGMSVSASSAAGLGACAPNEIGLGTNNAPTCPASSRIGTVRIDTPLLADPLEGDVILAKQDDNPFHSLLALYFVVKGPGFYIKLPGRVDPDPVTGQLTTTFDNTPQLPFSKLHVAFQGGSQAPLATPQTCGTYTSHAEITSWASETPVSLDTPMTIDQGCETPAFAPAFSAGTTTPLAGKDSPFSLTLTRTDRMPYLSNIDTVLPPGLLARIADVPRCPDAHAADGSCPVESQIGHTHVLSGPGAQPLAVTGTVSLTGPYRDAPFGLSIAVPTAGQAGPFDLGVIVVRAGIYVDRTTARVTVKSDQLPRIIQGIPLRMRQVNITIDRPNFMFNPTSCAPMSVFGGFAAFDGSRNEQNAAFQLGGCRDLDIDDELALRFTGRTATKDGTHPGIQATLTSKPGGSNLKTAEVKLPLSVALDPDNAEGLCKPEQRLALACPAGSIVGHARVQSILPDPLTGPVYFVEGLRKSASGHTVRTLPKLWIPLTADGVTIDVNADSQVDSLQRLVTTFHDIPDAPFSRFDLTITGGKHGIIVVSGKPGTCDRDKTIDSRFSGQNGESIELSPQAKVDGCKPKVTKTSSTSRAVTLRVNNLGAGRLMVAGAAVKRATRTIKAATEASITARMTTNARRALQRRGRVKVALSVKYQPKLGKPVTVRKTVVVKRPR